MSHRDCNRCNNLDRICERCRATRVDLYWERKYQNKCVACCKPKRNKQTTCNDCLAKTNASRRVSYGVFVSIGICTYCGKEPRGETLKCEKCRRHHILYSRRQRKLRKEQKCLQEILIG